MKYQPNFLNWNKQVIEIITKLINYLSSSVGVSLD